MRKFIILLLALCLIFSISILTACEENISNKSNGVDLIIKDVNKLQEVDKNQNSKNIDVDLKILDTTDDSLTLEYEIVNFYAGDRGILTITIDGFDYTFDIDKANGIISIALKNPLSEDSKLVGSFKLI